jgi:hypothetical protein
MYREELSCLLEVPVGGGVVKRSAAGAVTDGVGVGHTHIMTDGLDVDGSSRQHMAG